MKTVIGRAAIAVAGTIASGLALGAVPTAAQAASGACATLYFGVLCAYPDSSPGYRAVLTTTRVNVRKLMDFNLQCSPRLFGSQGAFRTEPNREYSYVFKVGHQGTCRVFAYDRETGEQFGTGNVTV